MLADEAQYPAGGGHLRGEGREADEQRLILEDGFNGLLGRPEVGLRVYDGRREAALARKCRHHGGSQRLRDGCEFAEFGELFKAVARVYEQKVDFLSHEDTAPPFCG